MGQHNNTSKNDLVDQLINCTNCMCGVEFQEQEIVYDNRSFNKVQSFNLKVNGSFDHPMDPTDEIQNNLTSIIENSQENYETSHIQKIQESGVTPTGEIKFVIRDKRIKSMYDKRGIEIEQSSSDQISKQSTRKYLLLNSQEGDQQILYDLKPLSRKSKYNISIIDSSQERRLSQIQENPNEDDSKWKPSNENTAIGNIKNNIKSNDSGSDVANISDGPFDTMEQPKSTIIISSRRSRISETPEKLSYSSSSKTFGSPFQKTRNIKDKFELQLIVDSIDLEKHNMRDLMRIQNEKQRTSREQTKLDHRRHLNSTKKDTNSANIDIEYTHDELYSKSFVHINDSKLEINDEQPISDHGQLNEISFKGGAPYILPQSQSMTEKTRNMNQSLFIKYESNLGLTLKSQSKNVSRSLVVTEQEKSNLKHEKIQQQQKLKFKKLKQLIKKEMIPNDMMNQLVNKSQQISRPKRQKKLKRLQTVIKT